MDFSVVAAAREDGGPVDGPVRVGVVADGLGFREVWAGEGPTWDAFVLATAATAARRDRRRGCRPAGSDRDRPKGPRPEARAGAGGRGPGPINDSAGACSEDNRGTLTVQVSVTDQP